MDPRDFKTPVTHDDVRTLKAGDLVTLTGDIVVTGGLPAHKRIVEYLDTGRELPIAMNGTFIHLPHMVSGDPPDAHVHYVNPTTSMRFDAFIPRFIRDLDLRIVGGKGGLGPDSARAMQEHGCIYLSMLGGGSPLLSAAIRSVRQIEWRDFPMHFRLSRLEVERFGPMVVGIDAHGNSLFEEARGRALERREAILERLRGRPQPGDAKAS